MLGNTVLVRWDAGRGAVVAPRGTGLKTCPYGWIVRTSEWRGERHEFERADKRMRIAERTICAGKGRAGLNADR